MRKTKYITFHTRREVCEWLDKHHYSSIIAIVQDGGVFTIFYYEYGEEDFIRDMEAVSCDPGFAIPAPRNVRTVRVAPMCQNAVAEPAPLC